MKINYRRLAEASSLGLTLPAGIAIGMAIGYWLDKWLKTEPWMILIWTLFGILGGIETFGLLGLFLGPTIMAILISVWRDSISELSGKSDLQD